MAASFIHNCGSLYCSFIDSSSKTVELARNDKTRILVLANCVSFIELKTRGKLVGVG